MVVTKYDSNHLLVGCSDRELLKVMQDKMAGSKVRMQNQIIIPLKSGPKLYSFSQYGIQWNGNTEEIVKQLSFNITKRQSNIQKIKSQYGGEIKFDYECKGKYKPMDHQKVMFNIMAYCDVAAILADPGTCKTASYLWAIDKRIQRGQVKKALIVTLSTLKKNVIAELEVQAPHLNAFVLGNKSQANKALNKTYSIAKKNIDYDVYVSNYESMFSLVDLFEEGYFDMVILDEAHRIGSPRSRQTKAIIDKFESVPYKYIITGTLNANNLMSFYMPYRFLGPDTVPYANFYEFRRQHMRTVDPDQRIWKPLSGAHDVVKQIIGSIAVSFTKDECLDLPPVIYQELSCDMGKSQAKLYKEMSKDMVMEVDDMCSKCNMINNCDMSCSEQLVAKNALVVTQKLRQIALGFYINTRVIVDDSGKERKASNIITLDENPKLSLLIQTLNNIPEGKQVIIWTNYTYAVEVISERLAKAFGEQSYITCYKDQDAFDQIAKFREENIPYLIGNPSKMGVGHNVQFSSYQVFFDNSYSWVVRDQAISRQHRKGQEDSVTIIDLTVSKSIDEIILKALKKKQDLSITLSELSKVLKRMF